MTSTAIRSPEATGPLPRRPGFRHGNAGRIKRSQYQAGYVFVLPTLILFAVFVGWPIAYTIYLSFSSWAGFGYPKAAGLQNYTRMFSDSVAMRALLVTIIFTAVTTALQTIIGLIIAVLVNAVWRTVGVVVRTILFIPGIVSFVVSGVLWKLIYDPNIGTLNRTLESIGLGGLRQTWLADPATVLPSIIVVSLWAGTGTAMLILFAGIQGIDGGLYEAAQVDGAGPVQQFFNVTVPQLRIVLGLVISLGLLNGLKVFDIIYVMTGGGPNHASEVLGTYLYGLAFGSSSGSIPQFGYASAFSIVTMILCTLAVLVQMKITSRSDR